jgi:hypothetical protein
MFAASGHWASAAQVRGNSSVSRQAACVIDAGGFFIGVHFIMTDKDQFGLLRKILGALGLSPEAVDEIIDRIVDLLSDKKAPVKLEFPYHLRDDFLSPAEQSFYLVLRKAAADWALICPKVALGDLFYVRSSDHSKYRIYTNKIDRKHVDFLLCDPQTARPILGIELDDKSHNAADRKARDEFVAGVFAAAKLPLARVHVQRSYNVNELRAALQQRTGLAGEQAKPTPAAEQKPAQPAAPKCPNCGSDMVLRTATTGANKGGKFWGCPNYPRCRGILKYEPATVSDPI